MIQHSVTNDKGDLFDRLKAEGLIGPGELYSPEDKKMVHFDAILNYKKWASVVQNELSTRETALTRAMERDIDSNPDIPDAAKDAIKAEFYNTRDKNSGKIVVTRMKNGGVGWAANDMPNQIPFLFVCRVYPDEVFRYFEKTNENISKVEYVKGETVVTPDGKRVEFFLPSIRANRVKPIDDKTVSVSFYLHKDDKKPVLMYVHKDDVVSYFGKGSVQVAIRKPGKIITIYNKASDGSVTKEDVSVDVVKRAFSETKRKYREKTVAKTTA